MAAAETAARLSGGIRMHLSVTPTNKAAVQFYEKLGWCRIGNPWTGSMGIDL
jgi:ribosomal protein S18 acetylase RimI-like enzyme